MEYKYCKNCEQLVTGHEQTKYCQICGNKLGNIKNIDEYNIEQEE